MSVKQSKESIEKAVLAIFPNALGIGYALFENSQTLVYENFTRIRPISNQKCLLRLKKILKNCKPDLILLEDYRSNSSSKRKRIKTLLHNFKKQADSIGIKVSFYSRCQIRKVFSVYGNRTKHDITKQIVDWFPELARKCPRPWKLGNAEAYNQGMFDAVSLGLTHYYLK